MGGKVLSVTSECVPFIKTGGLADVAGALPAAMAAHGWDMRTLLPAYPGLVRSTRAKTVVWAADDLFGGPGRVLAVPDSHLLLLDAPHLYDRKGGPYGNPDDYPDNPQRFAALSYAAAQIAMQGLSDGWTPAVLHAHDWQAGLAPAYLKIAGAAVRSVMTVHNIAFQGLANAALLGTLKLPFDTFNREFLEYWGQISTLKAGLVAADAITTVSPTYANELMRPAFGFGLEGVLARHADKMKGILNGIDTDVWDPSTAAHPYSAKAMKGKAANRKALLAEFGLSELTGPLAIVVSRLTEQKGIDLLVDAAPDFLARGGGLAILGSGSATLETALKSLAKAHPGKVGLRIGYDEALSHRMFAGGDCVLVPSRFEPCGLTQLYGLRYGTVPLVALTGGLADTVIDANPMALADGVATGFQFSPVDALGLGQALRRLLNIYTEKSRYAAMQKRGMTQSLGWATSSLRYVEIYESLIV